VEYRRAAFWGRFYSLYTSTTYQIFAVICFIYKFIYIYADDTKLYRHICNSEDQDNLQSGINRVKD